MLCVCAAGWGSNGSSRPASPHPGWNDSTSTGGRSFDAVYDRLYRQAIQPRLAFRAHSDPPTQAHLELQLCRLALELYSCEHPSTCLEVLRDVRIGFLLMHRPRSASPGTVWQRLHPHGGLGYPSHDSRATSPGRVLGSIKTKMQMHASTQGTQRDYSPHGRRGLAGAKLSAGQEAPEIDARLQALQDFLKAARVKSNGNV